MSADNPSGRPGGRVAKLRRVAGSAQRVGAAGDRGDRALGLLVGLVPPHGDVQALLDQGDVADVEGGQDVPAARGSGEGWPAYWWKTATDGSARVMVASRAPAARTLPPWRLRTISALMMYLVLFDDRCYRPRRCICSYASRLRASVILV